MSSIYDFSVRPEDKTTPYAWILEFTQNARSILEIGCATGFFSRYLVARGCRVTGVEINPAAAEKAAAICHRVILGDIESQDVQQQITEQFDAVIASDVLEHLRSPEELLVYIRQQWLKPEGYVVLSMPNSGHWIFRREVLWGRFPYRQYGLFDRSHLRFFTQASLYDMIEKAGFEIVEQGWTLNHNSQDDFTFISFKRFYHHRSHFRQGMLKLEQWLAKNLPALFVYQFVLKIQPTAKSVNS